MSQLTKLLLPYMMLMGSSSEFQDGQMNYFTPAPPTKGQKSLFNQPKKLSKKQKAKNRKK